MQANAQETAQPYIDEAKKRTADARSKADELSKEAQRKAQPLFDSAKDQYKEVEKQAIASKDKALKDAQPAIDDAKKKGQQVGACLVKECPYVLLILVSRYLSA